MKHINNNESTCLIDLDFLIHSDSIRFIYLLYKFSYLSSPNEASITPCAKNGSALATGGSLCGPFAKWCVQVLAQQNLFNFRVRYCELGRVFGHVFAKVCTKHCHVSRDPLASGRSLFVGTSNLFQHWTIDTMPACFPLSDFKSSWPPSKHFLNPPHIPVT